MADGADRQVRTRRIGVDEARVVVAIAEAVAPAGVSVKPAGARTVDAVELALDRFGPPADAAWLEALKALDVAAIALTGSRLSALPLDARTKALVRLSESLATAALVRAVTAPLKLAQVLTSELPETLGARVGVSSLGVLEERPRWMERVVDARTLDDGETLECDVVIVGSGAGGGPVARALASEGYAVIVLEEGGHFTRKDFRGRAWERGLAMQRQRGLIGNTFIAMPTGATVGGSTTVNSGTCLRTPPEVLRRWRFEDGLTELDPATMEPFFAKVEAAIDVGVGSASALGGCARVVARGAEALGWSHGALTRNATGCDGQGQCVFGCPTDAKRSTNVTYVPAALKAGAMLYHHARVDEVLRAGGRAVGVVARAKGEGGARLRVLAKTVVLAGGAIGTPMMLLRQGLANRSGEVGRNLTVHPASSAWADFDERIAGWEGIPQSYGIDQFVSEGIRFEGAFVPLDVAAPTFHAVGPAWTRFVDRFDHLACFGFMIEETSRGRVSLGPGGAQLLTYRMNDVDRRKVLRAHGLLARLFLAGGAREVFTGIRGCAGFRSARDVDRFEREAASTYAAHHLDLAAFHPLGTCRMGRDPSRSVVGPTHETHDVANLFVVDGSCVNGPLGVNPQITIMALAERASAFVARRVESTSKPATRTAAPLPRDAQVEFTETMRGRCEVLSTGRDVEAEFTVRAAAGDGSKMLRALFAEGGVMGLEGTATIGGMAERARCEGALTMRPLRLRGTLVYDLRFTGDDGVAYALHGEKNVSLATATTGMTTLHTEIARAADGVPVARGTLRFDLGDVVPWLATWRIRAKASAQ